MFSSLGLSFLRKSMLALFFRAGGAVLAYLSSVAVIGVYGVEVGSGYFTLLALWALIYGVGKFGLDTLALKNVAAYPGEVRSITAFFWGVAIKKLVVFVALVLFAALLVEYYQFGRSGFGQLLMLSGWIAPFTVLIFLMAAVMQGLGHILLSTFANGVSIPLIFVLLVYCCSGTLSYQELYFLANSSAFVVVFVVYFFCMRTKVRSELPVEFSPSSIGRSSATLTISTLLTLLNVWLGQLVASNVLDSTNEAVFGVGDRTSKLFMVLLMGVNAVIAPRIARLWSRQEYKELYLLIKQLVVVVSLAGLGLFALVVINADGIASLFGLSGETVSSVLVILCAGQLVNLMTGPSVFLLTMTGHERALVFIQLLGLMFFITVLLLWYSRGVVGIAFAQAVTISLLNVGCLIYGVSMLKKRLPQ